ncbi:MAG: [NiFe]-hydrogenase assembly chaperone HybE [Zoogloeaceae bacterium]|jgi:[NiFe] hydrogenase assembly HybE family chaperone|nr:[NiFe]-hydrogenase assembly chaperone HybE [Zoogloeaceae bacterium]
MKDENPAPLLERVFGNIAATRMADMPLANPSLAVEAVAFRRQGANGHWLGVLITPWAMNLLYLPTTDGTPPWPDKKAGDKHLWRFPSGAYEFTVAAEEALGVYHLCSLFSPPTQFATQEAARQTACATLAALMSGDDDKAAPADAPATSAGSRRAFLRLGR